MKICLLAFLLGLSTALLTAQTTSLTVAQRRSLAASPFGQVYRLRPEQAATLYRSAKDIATVRAAATDQLLNDLLAQVPTDTFQGPAPTRRLPYGHYALVRASGEQLSVEVLEISELQIFLVKDRRDFLLKVTDLDGQVVPNATVFLGGEKATFDAATGLFKIKKHYRGGLLEVYDGNRALFREVSGLTKRGYHRLRRYAFYSHGVGKVLYWPILQERRVVFWFKAKVLRNRYYYWPNKRQARYEKRHTLKGYVALSQPRYRPDDTLRVSAFLTDGKGRPLRFPLQMTVSSWGSAKKLTRQIKPREPGVFVFETPLRDSLQLDQSYQVTFTDTRHTRFDFETEMLASFRYEDYQLDVVNYQFKTPPTAFVIPQPVRLTVSARDANDQPVPEIRATLVLKARTASSFRADDVWVPDTLWRHAFDLDPRNETTVAVPDSIFPKNCNLLVTAETWFVNASGEQQVKAVTFERNQPDILEKLSAEIVGNVLTIKHLNPQKEKVQEAVLTTFRSNGDDDIRRISLPFTDSVTATVQRYEVQLGALKAVAAPDNEALELEGLRLRDTVFFWVKNPFRLPFRYLITSNRAEVVAEGVAQDTLWRWVWNDPQRQDLQLSVQYTWAGRSQEQSHLVYHYDRLLNLELDQPQRVLPGETVQVRVTAKDARQRPAGKVHLTAGAFNKQFGDSEPYVAPEITYGKGRWPRSFTNFQVQQDRGPQWSVLAPLSAPWFKQLQLDSLAYYRLRYQCVATGAWAERWTLPPDSTVGNRPQVAPWVVSQGRAEEVYLVYVNRELVYYANTVPRPYSFWAEKGWNQVQIRTRNHVYTVDSLWLEPGQKLEFSIDSTAAFNQKRIALPGQQVGLKVSVAARPDSLTAYEQEWLRKSLFYWRSDQDYGVGRDYFWQSAYNVFEVSSTRGGVYPMGPFLSAAELTRFRPREYVHRFEFEPGFVYEITPKRERLYAYPKQFGLVNRLPKRSGDHLVPGQKALTRSDIKIPPLPKPQLVLKQGTATEHRPGLGKFQWDIPPKSDSTMAGFVLLDVQKDHLLYGPFPASTRQLAGLKPGRYRWVGLQHNSQIAVKMLEVRADNLHFVRWEALVWTNPPADEQWLEFSDQFTLNYSPNVSKLTSQPSSFSQWPGATFGSTVSGIVRDKDGEVLIGASIAAYQEGVLVRGTISNVEGFFSLNLAPGVYDLQITYTGYEAQRLEGVVAGVGQQLDIALAPGNWLDEVVVTAYGARLVKADHTDGGRTLTTEQIRALPTLSVNAIQGRAAGVDIDQLEITDGPLNWAGDVTGGVISIKGNRATGQDYYLDGVRVRNFKRSYGDFGGTADTTQAFSGDPVALRKDFRDYAYWQPNLLTDRKGEAYFQVKFPDDQTAWSSFVVGMDRRKRGGVGRATTLAFKPLSAQLSLPRFAVAGDRFRANGLITNLDSDSVLVRSTFRQDGQMLAEQTRRVGPALSEFAEVVAPTGADSLHLSYEFQSTRGSDGEGRGIAVLPVGIRETSGQFWFLERDTTVVLNPENSDGGPVTVRVENSTLDLLLTDIQYLATYPYGCNEQTASRLTALLLLERLLPRLTPEQFEQQPLLARYRDPQVLKADIRACAARLVKNQLADGSWGWWENSPPNAWMTVYVVRALQRAKDAGYTTEALDRGLGWLRNSFARLAFNDQQSALDVLRSAGVNVNCEPVLARFDTTPGTLYERLGQWRLSQLCGRQVPRDSLLSYLKPSLFGGLYCGTDRTDWYDRLPTNTLLAYDLAEAAGYTDLTARIRRFWIESRTERPRNTFETAQILLRFVAADSTALAKQGKTNRLIVNGQQAISTFPAQQILPAGTTSVTLQKEGNAPLFVTAFQQWHNAAPTPRDDVFGVKTTLWQNNQALTAGAALQRGLAAELRVQVNVTARSEYVLVEVPIPAGCSYGEKEQPGGYWRGWRTEGEVHREYFRDRVAIFCEQLPVGQYEFKVALEPRFDGSFTLNPARAEQMYFPTFFGRNGVERVVIR